MKNSFFRNWYYRKNLFTHLLANIDNEKLSNNLKIWAYYRLGMYNSVLSIESSNLNWRAYFAKISSLAALGQYEAAENLLSEFYKCEKYHLHLELLIKALSPYMSEIAFDLTKRVRISFPLEIALLIKIDEQNQALEKLKIAVDHKIYRTQPELLLLYSNLLSDDNYKKRVTILNKFLLQFNLTKIKCIDNSKCISIRNLASKCNTINSSVLVTIIMTSYNSSLYIESAINSILMQSYTNIELIIVDDCSTDSTTLIIESFIKLDKRLKLIKLEKNVGTYVAKNIALEKAQGEFITCHDSDDFSHPLKIERQVLPLIKNKKLVASISDWIRIDEDGKYYTRYVYPLMRLNLSSLMYRKKEVLDKIGYYDCVRTGADSEYYARIVLVFGKKNIKRVKKPLSFGAHRENSLMTAKDTGHNDVSISDIRLAYWEAWNNWHINATRMKEKLFVPFDVHSNNIFKIPKEIEVKKENILFVKQQKIV